MTVANYNGHVMVEKSPENNALVICSGSCTPSVNMDREHTKNENMRMNIAVLFLGYGYAPGYYNKTFRRSC